MPLLVRDRFHRLLHTAVPPALIALIFYTKMIFSFHHSLDDLLRLIFTVQVLILVPDTAQAFDWISFWPLRK